MYVCTCFNRSLNLFPIFCIPPKKKWLKIFGGACFCLLVTISMMQFMWRISLWFTPCNQDGKSTRHGSPSETCIDACRANPHHSETITIFLNREARESLNTERHLVCSDIFKAECTNCPCCLSNKGSM